MLGKQRYFIGIMSGTSLDGVDAALVREQAGNITHVDSAFLAYPEAIKSALLALHHPSDNELHLANILANQLADLYAQATHRLLTQARLSPSEICAIGCHGQTIRHCPSLADGTAYTLQIGNNARLAELTNITVVGDFRSRDIAAGGQGAPLVPAFHQAVFASPDVNRVILNIGGIANVSYLPTSCLQSADTILGFDTGPGNMLIDHWVKQHLNMDYDAGGAWSAGGKIITPLLEAMLAEPYFALPPPKSTGRDLFHAQWLNAFLNNAHANHAPQDVACTLLELTALSIAQAIARDCPNTHEVYVCGGGAHNHLLMQRLSQHCGLAMQTTDALGVGVDWVEAVAFAWLAQRCIDQLPGNLPAVTGAQGHRILGAIYPQHQSLTE
jgi:anhydro-N-acetylmuramic acid kinase